MKSKILTFRDRFDILMEIRLGGVAKRLIWEMSDYNFMPFTPFHFGPSGFIGLVFRKWLDIPVFVLANVIVDIETLVDMLFNLRNRYCHTLLIGTAVGALWGLAAYPLRNLFIKLMQLLRIPYKISLPKMLISGILGVWLHILIDGPYHFDVKIHWLNKIEFLVWMIHRHLEFLVWMIYRHLGLGEEQNICLIFFPAALIAYIFAVRSFSKNRKLQNAPGASDSIS